MRIIPILLISFFLFSACGKAPIAPTPKPITPLGTGSIVDLPQVSVSGEIKTGSGK